MRRTKKIHQWFGVVAVIIGLLFMADAAWADWQQQQKLSASDANEWDYFGTSVAIDGNYAIVGACYADVGGPIDNRGAAYIFKWTGSNWSQQDKLLASDGASGDNFGWSVSISGEYAIISAPGDNSSIGSAYIFKRNGTSWSQQAKLTASDGATGDEFSYSVSISGDYAIVGAYDDTDLGINNCGSAYIFEKPPGGWVDATETIKLFAFEPGPTSSERFGFSVAIDGNTAIVGANFSSPTPQLIQSGAAYIFKREGIYWVPQPPKLTASDAKGGDEFGSSVAIDANYAVVGAPWDDIDAFRGQTGCAYIFKCIGGPMWTEQDILYASDLSMDDYFGWSVSISGNLAIVGTFADSAYIFRRRGTSWTELEKLTAWDGAPGCGFGWSVSMGASQTIVGATTATGNATQSGAAYTFERVCPTADLTGDCCVDYYDLEQFTRFWLYAGCFIIDCGGADLDNSGEVNFADYAKLVSNWLKYN